MKMEVLPGGRQEAAAWAFAPPIVTKAASALARSVARAWLTGVTGGSDCYRAAAGHTLVS